jgi:hypothetical protein
MSYHRNRSTPAALGDLASTITGIASTVGVATDLANDPYLPEAVCHVGQLKALNNGQRPAACAKTAPNLAGGVGLRKLMPAMRAYVYAEQNKWAYGAAAAVVIGVPFLLGFLAGKGNR